MNYPALPPIPADTAMRARASFHPSHVYMRLGSRAAQLLEGVDLSEWYQFAGSSGLKPHLLLMLTLMQYREQLSDAQACEAVRVRMDWKYALHLPVAFFDIQPGLLCDYRSYLLTHSQGQAALQQVISRMVGEGFLQSDCTALQGSRKPGSPPLAAAAVLQSVCTVDRLHSVGQAVNAVIEGIAARESSWLRAHMLPHWLHRYYQPKSCRPPESAADRAAVACSLGRDVRHSLKEVSVSDFPELERMPEVQELRRIWRLHYEPEDATGEEFYWRAGCARCPRD